MGEFINASIVFILGWGSVAIIAIVIYRFIRQLLIWAKNINF